jgi:hypothetical protein
MYMPNVVPDTALLAVVLEGHDGEGDVLAFTALATQPLRND